MKKILSVIVILALVLSLTACGAATTSTAGKVSAENPIVIVHATTAVDEHIQVIATKAFGDRVAERTNGAVVFEHYTNGQLGGDPVTLQGVQAGTIGFCSTATTSQVTLVPEMALFDIPFFYSNREMVDNLIYDQTFLDIFREKYAKLGYHLLGINFAGYRWTTADRPIYKLEDLKGLKIRTMENPYHVSFWRALGASPTPLANSERYAALQQGTVNAQENSVEQILNTKMYEVQDYVINTKHIGFIGAFLMNKQLYDSIPEEYRKILDEEFEIFCKGYSQQAIDKEAVTLQTLQNDYKMTVIDDLGEAEYERWRLATKETENMIRKEIGDDIVDMLYERTGTPK